ncbi:UDP-glucose 4-epimerase GalE [Rhodobacterales bacterium FZCC0069]|nr:UDP-glucose 4-epimerase GalE [Rhodobacterales bacterium FZCC0069]
MSINVLVTGGAGYIGSHTCKALAEAGYMPIVYDNLSRGNKWAVQWGPLEVADLGDRNRLHEVIDKYHPAAVIHFAAYAYVGESVQDPIKYYMNNVTGSLELFRALNDKNIKKLIFSSTCATYGHPKKLPINERHPQQPINPYGESKLMVEKILKDLDASNGLRSISLRYFNAAGADPDGAIGEFHSPETHLIPLVLDVAAGDREQISVFGGDYDTPDGTCIRDYVHVTDLAEAHVLALQSLLCGSGTNAYNVAHSTGFSVKEIVTLAQEITGAQIKTEIIGRREGDPAVLIGDASLIKKELAWKPIYSSLESILRTAWRWHNYTKKYIK